MYLTKLVKYLRGRLPALVTNRASNGVAFRRAAAALAIGAGALASQPAAAQVEVERELECLALTIYHEARGEPGSGQVAVGHVVMNRVYDRRFPKNVCAVVQQGGFEIRNRCHFSWYCDGQSDRPLETVAWVRSQELARRIYWGFSVDPTDGALWYHADYVGPKWRLAFTRGPKIGRHIFYTVARNSTAS